MAELLSYAETQKLLDELSKDQQKLAPTSFPARSRSAACSAVAKPLPSACSVRDFEPFSKASAEAATVTRNLGGHSETLRCRPRAPDFKRPYERHGLHPVG